MKIESSAFGPDQNFPVKYSKEGENISPPLEWSELPEGTKELALVFEDITPRTREPFVHWLVYKIPAGWENLPEGFKHRAEPEAPAHLLQGKTSIGNVGYDAPLGTAGKRIHYRFQLFALNQAVDLQPGLNKQELLDAVSPHVKDRAEMEVTYERPRPEQPATR